MGKGGGGSGTYRGHRQGVRLQDQSSIWSANEKRDKVTSEAFARKLIDIR